MNLSEHLCVDKELFSFTFVPENTMNLYVDKELFSGVYVEKYISNAYFYIVLNYL